MFIALDESFNNSYTTLGCICLPQLQLGVFESQLISCRLKNKVWGELKWERITETYLPKYQEFLNVAFNTKDLTYHSWTYKNPSRGDIKNTADLYKNKLLYKHAYLLLRSVIRKHRNDGYKGTFYIVADETGSLGLTEYKKTNDLLIEDKSIRPPATIEFCSTGTSHICGALQIADICTGATNYVYSTNENNKKLAADKIVETLQGLNNGFPINFSHPTLPKLQDFKMHHCLFYKK